jgi:predicted O-methyltransferase YrrM
MEVCDRSPNLPPVFKPSIVALLKLIFRFLRYYFRAKTRYNVQSPFVFDFTEHVLEDDRWFYAFWEIEVFRRFLRTLRTKIALTDFGAGSKFHPGTTRSIASLARYSASRPFACRWLFKIVEHYKPETMLELGTSLGISTAYQAAAARNARMVTIEGCPNIAHLAAENFKHIGVQNITLLQGRFEDMLPAAFGELQRLDYVFFDGNHRKEPTLKYFELCLEHAHEGSIFVFDDIHWSAGMEAAWQEIKNHPKVRLTLDLFFFGVVFFRKEQKVKEHFTLVKWTWKPWAVGVGDFFGWN